MRASLFPLADLRLVDAHEDGYSITCIVLLTDNFEGGGTSFWPADDHPDRSRGTVVEPLVGTALLFNGETTHSGNPVSSGTRHLYVASFDLVSSKI